MDNEFRDLHCLYGYSILSLYSYRRIAVIGVFVTFLIIVFFWERGTRLDAILAQVSSNCCPKDRGICFLRMEYTCNRIGAHILKAFVTNFIMEVNNNNEKLVLTIPFIVIMGILYK